MEHQEQRRRYDELAKKLLDGTITPPEREEYLEWLQQDDGQTLDIPAAFAESKRDLEVRMLTGIRASIADQPSVSRNFKWIRYAAAAVVVIAAGAALLFRSSSHQQEQTIADTGKPPAADVAPGGNKASLTLSDGTTIPLDGVANGTIAKQGNSSIVKLSNGKIVYDLKGLGGTEERMNTMTTPKGGQYQLTLEDGTKVWLNAASSITYPAVFVGKERSVKVTGEAYFEVAKNKTKPFVVSIDGKYAVQVLGTSFNINSYADDEHIRTTLIEGSIKVENVVLKPRQQAVIDQDGAGAAARQRQGISVRTDINADEVLAWKEGYFQFNGASLTNVLLQLARWYDVDVEYGKEAPAKTFVGEIPRDATLSQVLRVLEKTGVHFKIEGKKIVVLP